MQITLDCLPCFVRNAVEVSREFTTDEALQLKMVQGILEMISGTDLTLTPPELAGRIHAYIREILKNDDPYAAIKKNANVFAEQVTGRLKKLVDNAEDPFRKAVLYSIAGNIIDSGISAVTSEAEIEKSIWMAENIIPEIDRGKELSARVDSASEILILGDNAGEIVFDRLLLREIQKRQPNAVLRYAVKSGPILNDATMEDALSAGLDSMVEIITNGTRIPGTPLGRVAQEFKAVFDRSDLIIAKGQANFETLCGVNDPRIFFLLRAKCSVIAKLAGVTLGSFVIANFQRRVE